MGSSLVKFANRIDGNGRGKLYWGRAEHDGLPFRGPMAPMFTEEEYEERVVRVADPRNGTFRTWDPVENQQYLDVMDKILNGWATCLFAERWRARVRRGKHTVERHVVYIEWAEYYLEDGSRSPVGYGQPMEHAHGQANGGANPLPSPGGKVKPKPGKAS